MGFLTRMFERKPTPTEGEQTSDTNGVIIYNVPEYARLFMRKRNLDHFLAVSLVYVDSRNDLVVEYENHIQISCSLDSTGIRWNRRLPFECISPNGISNMEVNNAVDKAISAIMDQYERIVPGDADSIEQVTYDIFGEHVLREYHSENMVTWTSRLNSTVTGSIGQFNEYARRIDNGSRPYIGLYMQYIRAQFANAYKTTRHVPAVLIRAACPTYDTFVSMYSDELKYIDAPEYNAVPVDITVNNEMLTPTTGDTESAERTLHVHGIYRHFKGNYYMVEDVANDSETGRKMVVYRHLYGDHCLCVRPLDMFMSDVDHDKYPGVAQKYRFEEVDAVGK